MGKGLLNLRKIFIGKQTYAGMNLCRSRRGRGLVREACEETSEAILSSDLNI